MLAPYKYPNGLFYRCIMEIWKDINGYDGLYQVSNYGNIKSVKSGRVLSAVKNNRNYLYVGLYKNKKRTMFQIHRLVAAAFVNNPCGFPCVNHKDENAENNKAENLEWCSYRYNNVYGTRLERASKSKYKPVNQYSIKGAFLRRFCSIQDANEFLGQKQTHISDCCKGKRKTACGYVWKFE